MIRNNIISNLAEIHPESTAIKLQSTMYSVEEYNSAEWIICEVTKKINIQLYQAMRQLVGFLGSVT